MSNTVNLEFAGDAAKLAAAGKKAEQTASGVGDAVTDASQDMARAGAESTELGTRMGRLGAATAGGIEAMDALGGSLQAVIDIQEYAKDKAARLARALVDVEQAQNDLNQAQADGRQATLDVGQAQIDAQQAALDAKQAVQDYADAVKEHGRGSLEAKQALIDLNQAEQDNSQATEDLRQAQLDAAQAVTDAKSAQLDLNEAHREANPPDMQEWADKLALITPLLTAMMGATALVTAAQWAWNAAQLASPTTWIILAIAALIAIIVVIATKTDWFQRAWRASWRWIKDAAKNTWDWLKQVPDWIGSAFRKIANFITAPFRAAFNAVARLWNSTVGRLSFTIPGWVPGIGGAGFSMPRIPTFHQGGRVPGAPGTEVIARVQAGETITSMAGSVGAGRQEWIRVDLGELGEVLLESIARAVSKRGGSVTALGVRVSASGRVV